MKTTQQILQAAKAVSLALPLTTDAKNQALLAMADLLVAQQNVILEANAVTSSHSEIIYLRLLAFDKEMRYTIDKGV